MSIITVTIFFVCKIGPVNIKGISKLLFSVKGPGLCNLETKVMNIWKL